MKSTTSTKSLTETDNNVFNVLIDEVGSGDRDDGSSGGVQVGEVEAVGFPGESFERKLHVDVSVLRVYINYMIEEN